MSYAELKGQPPTFDAPLTISARDEFDQSAGALTGKTAPVGGVWVGAGDADDSSVETTGKTAQRTAVSDANHFTGRYHVSGVAAFAAQTVQVDFKSTTVAPGGLYQGVLARYVDVNNWLSARVLPAGPALYVHKRVASTVSVIGTFTVPAAVASVYRTIRLSVDAFGAWSVWLWTTGVTPSLVPLGSGQDANLATGGTLDDGKPGFSDTQVDATANTRNYDNFIAFPATKDAAMFASQSLEFRHDRSTRENAAGTLSSRLAVDGKRLLVPPAGPDSRTTRMVVKGHRNDPTIFPDGGIDDITAQLFVTPRGTVVPE